MAKLFFKAVICTMLFMVSFLNLSFGQDVAIENLVDKYVKDTDIEKSQAVKEYIGKKIAVTGVVENTADEGTFDLTNDKKRQYYKIVTTVANTKEGNPYRIVMIYKNIDKVRDLNKGQKISASGEVIKIVDDRLYISVWLSADELTQEEISLFK